ncbi:MAG: SDR family oxidoreductase [Fuerstiella sp.]|nr:SDR family oxidoreductase [Fuerstiella sp.]MCP4855137.1 SDR family oxidoreductase [Fuerstiella sp.]
MCTDQYNFKGKSVLVTGAARGIGFAIAEGFARAGATVFANDLSADSVDAAIEKMSGTTKDVTVLPLPFDVTDEPAVIAALTEIDGKSGRLDICVSNAGTQHRETVDTLDTQTFSRVVDENLVSHFSVAKHSGAGMAARGYGRLILVTSILALHGRAGLAPYCAAKAGLVNLIRVLSAEFGGSGVTVNGLGPGFIETELTADIRRNQEVVEKVNERTPVARWGRPEDVVGPALFLASDSSSFVTGQTLYVDGGLTSVFS